MRREQEIEDRGDVRRERFRREEEFWRGVVASQSPHKVLRDPHTLGLPPRKQQGTHSLHCMGGGIMAIELVSQVEHSISLISSMAITNLVRSLQSVIVSSGRCAFIIFIMSWACTMLLIKSHSVVCGRRS